MSGFFCVWSGTLENGSPRAILLMVLWRLPNSANASLAAQAECTQTILSALGPLNIREQTAAAVFGKLKAWIWAKAAFLVPALSCVVVGSVAIGVVSETNQKPAGPPSPKRVAAASQPATLDLAERMACVDNLKQLAQAAKKWAALHGNRLPNRLSELNGQFGSAGRDSCPAAAAHDSTEARQAGAPRKAAECSA